MVWGGSYGFAILQDLVVTEPLVEMNLVEVTTALARGAQPKVRTSKMGPRGNLWVAKSPSRGRVLIEKRLSVKVVELWGPSLFVNNLWTKASRL